MQKNAHKLMPLCAHEYELELYIAMYIGRLDKKSHSSAVILSDFSKHSNITHFYMYFLLIIFLNYEEKKLEEKKTQET